MQLSNPGQELTFDQHLDIISKSGKTAITRKTYSAPVKKLIALKVFDYRHKGFKVLDYGCGKGKDVELLSIDYPHLRIDEYDPNHRKLDTFPPYDLIFCNYVLNVISLGKVREFLLQEIRNFLKDSGVAYVTVRNDKDSLNGITKLGTWQGLIELDLDVLYSNSNFKMYRMTKNG